MANGADNNEVKQIITASKAILNQCQGPHFLDSVSKTFTQPL